MRVSLSYLGSEAGRYVGVYALPGDIRWRYVRAADGGLSYQESPEAAEASAGHALVAALRKLEGAA